MNIKNLSFVGVFMFILLLSGTMFVQNTYALGTGGCTTDCGTGGGSTGGGSTGGSTTKHPPVCDISVNVTKVKAGDSFTVSWNGTPSNADFKINGGVVNDKDSYTTTFNGSYDYMRYVLYGKNSDGECSKEVVIYKDVPAPVCDVTLNITEVAKIGDPYTITWNGTPTSGTFKMNGTVVADAGSVTKTFVGPNKDSFTFTGINGSYTCTKTVSVTVKVAAAPVCTLTATPSSIVTGGTSKLTWTSSNAVSGSINQSVGTVNPSNTAGFRNVTPTATKTYTMTVLNSAGVSATCNATVTVSPVVVPAPVCTLTATPNSIVSGSNSQLKWTSSNALSGSINQSVGVISLTNTAGQSVSPTFSKTYTMTVTNSAGVTATCNALITVTTPAPDAPVCEYFRANPTTINRGSATTLSWSSIRATSASINNGVGSVAVASTYTVSPLESTTYTLTLNGAGGTTNCTVPVTVIQPQTSFSCAQNVQFYADDNSINEGESTKLHWDTNGVTSVSLSDFGSQSVDGSVTVSPSSNRTYTLTASNGSATVSCPLTVDVASVTHHGGSSPSPRCSLKISDANISLGERTTLTWDTSSAYEMTLKDSDGKTLVTTEDRSSSDKSDLFDGEMTLRPEKDTTYTLRVERGSKDDDCEVKVDVSGVVVAQVRDQQSLVSGIALTSVPYTGFEAGPIMTFIFYGLLALWALYLAYVLVVKRGALSFATATPAAAMTPVAHINATDAHGVFTPAAVTTPVFHQSATVATDVAPSAVTVGYASTVADTSIVEIENHAHAARVLLSTDAITAFTATTATENRIAALDALLATAKGTYPTEDGWVILGEERMRTLLAAQVA